MKELIRSRVGSALEGMLGEPKLGARDVKKVLADVASDLNDTYARDIPKGFSVGREVRRVGYRIIKKNYQRAIFGDWKLKTNYWSK